MKREKRGDDFFAAVGNKFCCSEHFLPMDYNIVWLVDLHVRQDFKLGTVPSVFPWTKVNEESLCREKKTKRASFRLSPSLRIIYLASKIPCGSFLLGSFIRPSGEAPKLPFSFFWRNHIMLLWPLCVLACASIQCNCLSPAANFFESSLMACDW